MPEFMTPEMRETIGANVLLPEHTAKIKSHLARSETACDDTHQFNPSRFDMEHATGYKSQSNGLVENANRTLSKLLE